MEFDVLIVGAGPAGAMTACEIAQENLNVLMIDRKKEAGIPVQCAEYVPGLISREVSINHNAIASEIKKLMVYFPNKEIYEFSAPGYILNRSVFDRDLILKATKFGVWVWFRTKFLGIEDNKIWLLKDGKRLNVNARIIVGADGPGSRVSRLINRRYKGYVVAYQQELPLIEKMEHTEVYFDKKFFGGYAWLFPKKESANVGVGVKVGHKIRLRDILNEFIERMVKQKKVLGYPLKTVTGLIPVNGPLNTVKDNILLVGDAAGQTHPITGAGIPQAIVCGKLAGQAIVSALKKDDLSLLLSYEENWRRIYFDELERAIKKRRKMETNWDRLDDILKECWVSFPEYYG